VTRYELFKKRIAPVLFLAMVGLIAYDSCDAQQRTHATIVLELGEAEAAVTSIRAELVSGGEVIGTFERRALSGLRIGCPCRFETAMPEESGQLRVEASVDGVRRTVTKPIHATEEATIRVLLEQDLLR
jgi:hypothetical protein